MIERERVRRRHLRRSGRIVLLAALLVAPLARGSAASDDPAPTVKHTPTGPRRGWIPEARRTAEELAQKVAASSIGCVEATAADYAALSAVLKERGLPVPDAVTQCLARDEEDLTFDVFASHKEKDAFVAAKLRLLCASATKARIDFSFVYVDGPSWIVEPDDEETADALAPLLGGTAQRRGCE